MKKFQKFGFLLSLLILVGMFFIQPTEMLPLAARNTLGVLLTVIVLLVTEALPMSAVCLLSVSMLVLFGCVESVPAALSGYTNQIVFFIIASFGIYLHLILYSFLLPHKQSSITSILHKKINKQGKIGKKKAYILCS